MEIRSIAVAIKRNSRSRTCIIIVNLCTLCWNVSGSYICKSLVACYSWSQGGCLLSLKSRINSKFGRKTLLHTGNIWLRPYRKGVPIFGVVKIKNSHSIPGMYVHIVAPGTCFFSVDYHFLVYFFLPVLFRTKISVSTVRGRSWC